MMFASMIEIVIMPRFGTGANACPFIGGPPRHGIIQGKVMSVAIAISYSGSLDLILDQALLGPVVRLPRAWAAEAPRGRIWRLGFFRRPAVSLGAGAAH